MSSIFSWSPFSRSQSSLPQQREQQESIELRHGRQTYPLTFRPGTLQQLTVSELKSLARKEAKLSDDIAIKLLFQGRRLDDKESLAIYNVRDGSRILMTSSQRLPKPSFEPANDVTAKVKPAKPASKSVLVHPSALEKISAIRQNIKSSYGAQISKFVQSPPSTQKERAETKARLSELLLQQLLKFDDVIIDPDDYASNEARLERKAAVKWVQGLMDEIDRVDIGEQSIANESLDE